MLELELVSGSIESGTEKYMGWFPSLYREIGERGGYVRRGSFLNARALLEVPRRGWSFHFELKGAVREG